MEDLTAALAEPAEHVLQPAHLLAPLCGSQVTEAELRAACARGRIAAWWHRAAIRRLAGPTTGCLSGGHTEPGRSARRSATRGAAVHGPARPPALALTAGHRVEPGASLIAPWRPADLRARLSERRPEGARGGVRTPEDYQAVIKEVRRVSIDEARRTTPGVASTRTGFLRLIRGHISGQRRLRPSSVPPCAALCDGCP